MSMRGQVFGAALRTRYSLTLSVSPGGGALVASEQAALASVYQQCAGCDAFIFICGAMNQALYLAPIC